MKFFLGLSTWCITLTALICTGCTFLRKYYRANNAFEEFVEDVIEEKSGWKVDLSPWEAEEEKAEKRKDDRVSSQGEKR